MIWQTSNWQKLLKETNQVDKIINLGGFSIEKRSLGMHQYGLFILGFSGELDGKLEDQLIQLCKNENALFIQLENNNYHGLSILGSTKFKEGYYKKFITPYTAVIDLSQSIEDILSQMKQKGRYNIRLTEKKGVEVKLVEKNDKNIKEFYDLMNETTSRDNFLGNTFEYYKSFLNILENSELILAYKDGIAIAGGIFVFSNEESIYYYGASTSKKEYRNLMAPYAVQFLAIGEAKNRGSKIYDFLGIATPGDTNSDLSGVTDFKLKLTKDSRAVSQSFIWINKRFHYTMLVLIRKIKKILRK